MYINGNHNSLLRIDEGSKSSPFIPAMGFINDRGKRETTWKN
ncbi:hypothetical protein HMPREF9374_0549 [Desmospora sp. 8437]|nr:hypothetical protein HMPREF9374_0549 [Desmospora sp. 8437]